MTHRLADLEVDEVMEIALSNNITVYDSSHIALAKQLGAPVVSNDKDILESAPRYRVTAYDLNEFLEVLEEHRSP